MKQPKRSKYASLPSTTIKNVAERARVSTATVSRVLTGSHGVSEDLRTRVREAVRSLNYQPNRIARHLRARATRTIGVLIPDIQNPFFTSVIRGVEDALQAAEYTLLLCNSDDNQARERLYLSTLRAEGVAGIIFVTGDGSTAEFKRLREAHMPLVAIDRVPKGLDVDLASVANDEGARAATAHLLALGHRRIGFISGPLHLNTAAERLDGYEQELRAAGLSVLPELIQPGGFRQAGGYEAMQRLLDLQPLPSAVFASNNLMTLGALQAIHERGLRLPSDLALVSFDDMDWATSLQPPLTAVAQPTYELGLSAAELMLARLQHPERPVRHVVLQTQLIVRASCGSGRGQQTGAAPIDGRSSGLSLPPGA